MTRSEAMAAGLTHYDEGRRPCPRGHQPIKRLVSNGQCVACCREYAARTRITNPERWKRIKANYKALHPERVLQQAKDTYWRTRDVRQAKHKEWQAKNPHKRREHEAARRAKA